MPHGPRKESASGFHHVVTKGDGAQVIFESDADRARYLEELEEALGVNAVLLHAYCLMSNHVHLLVQDPKGNLSAFMKQLNERYAQYFSKVSGRVGHVFQRPYWSEPIETDARFLSTLRYIHANPEVAGMCPASMYEWSSYKAHLTESPFVEVDFARALLGGARQFEEFSAAGGKQAKPFNSSKLRFHLSYDELLRIAWLTVGKETLNSLKAMQPEDRRAIIVELHEAGLSVAEISRFSSLGRKSVESAL